MLVFKRHPDLNTKEDVDAEQTARLATIDQMLDKLTKQGSEFNETLGKITKQGSEFDSRLSRIETLLEQMFNTIGEVSNYNKVAL